METTTSVDLVTLLSTIAPFGILVTVLAYSVRRIHEANEEHERRLDEIRDSVDRRDRFEIRLSRNTTGYLRSSIVKTCEWCGAAPNVQRKRCSNCGAPRTVG